MKKKTKYPFGSPLINFKEISNVGKVLKSKILVHGQHTINFENKFKMYFKITLK